MKKIPVLACSSVAILALGLSIALPSGFAQNVENTTNQSVQTISENTIHSETASSGPVTLKASWDETKLGSPTTFHVEATGGSDKYMFRMDAPSYSSPDEYAFESVFIWTTIRRCIHAEHVLIRAACRLHMESSWTAEFCLIP